MTILSKVTLANANAAQTILYLFLLMLCKVSPCKIFCGTELLSVYIFIFVSIFIQSYVMLTATYMC